MLAILAALMWGFVPVLDKTALASGISIYTAILVRSVGAILVMGLVVMLTGGLKPQEFSVRSVSILMAAGAIAGGIAMVVYFMALQKIGAAKTVPITSIYPLFTIVFSALILRENFDYTNVFIGTLLIVAGLIVLQR
ncbi:putative membrane protein [Geoglobus ahangari]|uniref:Putative membrane protein n=2 Tax=Geoglobus ahangari TaxID=113653 RepID=A0A0F7IET1_9EURY|nr:putative membrane protein [Geoglobus ahangari]